MIRPKGYIVIGLVCFFYWVLDSIWSKLSFEYNLKTMIFSEQGSYLDTFLLKVSPYQMVSRLMVVCLFFLIGIIAIEFIIKRQAAKRELMESEEKYRLIVENQNDLVVKFDSTQRIVYASPSFCRTFGKSENEIAGSDLKSLIHSEDVPLVQTSLAKLTQEPHVTNYEERAKTVEGWKWFSWSAKAVMNRDGKIEEIISVGRDITELKQLTNALGENEKYLDNIINTIADLIFVKNREHKWVLLNDEFCQFVGQSREELLGKSDHDFFPKNQADVFWSKDEIVFTSGKENINEEKITDAKGEVRTIVTKKALYTDDKNEQYLVGIISDITDHVSMEEQLRQAEKMESIGTLTGGIAHDFNNLLYMIVGNTDLALEYIPQSNPVYTNIEEIKSASLRAADIVKQLLSFSRKTDQKLIPIDAVTVVKDSLSFLRSTIPTTLEIHEHMPEDEIVILADSTQINQIMMNLCINASQAMEETGGTLKINIEKTICEAEDIKEFIDLVPGNFLKITVNDSGPGISPEIIKRIFDPYFTTKQMGKGSGLGLSIVHGIIKNHSGAVWVDSNLGQGTTFTLLFPMVEEKSVNKTKTDDDSPSGIETILFVDDEQAITKMNKMVLEKLGYRVEAMLNPVDVLDLFKLKPDVFDLVITDMTMPQMTGAKLAEKLKEIRSDIPIIICTGHSSLIDEEKAKELGIDGYIMKPASMSTMAKAIRNVLEK